MPTATRTGTTNTQTTTSSGWDVNLGTGIWTNKDGITSTSPISSTGTPRITDNLDYSLKDISIKDLSNDNIGTEYLFNDYLTVSDGRGGTTLKARIGQLTSVNNVIGNKTKLPYIPQSLEKKTAYNKIYSIVELEQLQGLADRALQIGGHINYLLTTAKAYGVGITDLAKETQNQGKANALITGIFTKVVTATVKSQVASGAITATAGATAISTAILPLSIFLGVYQIANIILANQERKFYQGQANLISSDLKKLYNELGLINAKFENLNTLPTLDFKDYQMPDLSRSAPTDYTNYYIIGGIIFLILLIRKFRKKRK